MSDFFATPWTIALQAPLSMGFSRQEYWSGLPFSPPGALLDGTPECIFCGHKRSLYNQCKKVKA